MKITLSLLKDFLDIEKSTSEIADLLTLAGLEVDKIENDLPSFSNVVAARVLEVEKHPDAEKLHIAKVTDGTETFQVVCGAPNCRKDLMVAFAKVGAFLTDENQNQFKIKKAKLRGIESFGMLCSAKELKISEDNNGIIELDEKLELGTDLSYFFLDPIFEISLTPNLGHCMSAIGIAREIAALTNTKIKVPSLNKKTIPNGKKVTTQILDDNTKRYCSQIVENVEVTPSPFWLKKTLESCGIRSINSVVDALNYIMLKFGQPLHAFDLDKLEDGKIIATEAKEASGFLCLDNIKRSIPKGSIKITDGKKAVAIAGVIGGLNSSVTEDTKNILIESACFDPMSIRKTSKELNLKTESSMRFEKGIDPLMTPLALEYASSLINELSPNSIIREKTDLTTTDFPKRKIKCRLQRVIHLLGTHFSLSEIEEIFNRLEFKVLSSKDDSLLVEVPTYRNDISQEIDLIEEIARIYGYNNLEKKPALYQSSKITHAPSFLFERQIKSYLLQSNLQEMITCDLISPKLSQITYDLGLTKTSLIETLHYKSIDQSILRPSLLPSLLEVVKYNHDHKSSNIAAFELSRVHFKRDDTITEQTSLAIVLSGKKAHLSWDKKNSDVDFFDLKGILENILDATINVKYHFNKSNTLAFHPGRQANIVIDNIEIGTLGEIHPNILNSFDIKKRVYFAEINLNSIFENKKSEIKLSEISSYPSSDRDLTITLDDNTEVQKVFDIINNLQSKYLEKVFLLDIFKNSQETKNVTFRFTYRDLKKTITYEEAEKEHKSISDMIFKQI